MATISRVRVTWTGNQVVGPGVSTFFVEGTAVTGWPAALVTFFTAIKNYVPTGITWTIPGVTDTITVENGQLSGASSPGGGGTVASSGGAVDYKPGVGARMRWLTSGVVDGRKVAGTTFLVPTTAQEIPNGILQASTVTAITNAMNTYRLTSGITPCVYSREREADPTHVPPITQRDGSAHAITAVLVPNGLTWLRSRRT